MQTWRVRGEVPLNQPSLAVILALGAAPRGATHLERIGGAIVRLEPWTLMRLACEIAGLASWLSGQPDWRLVEACDAARERDGMRYRAATKHWERLAQMLDATNVITEPMPLQWLCKSVSELPGGISVMLPEKARGAFCSTCEMRARELLEVWN